jgi:hypothetical protein
MADDEVRTIRQPLYQAALTDFRAHRLPNSFSSHAAVTTQAFSKRP